MNTTKKSSRKAFEPAYRPFTSADMSTRRPRQNFSSLKILNTRSKRSTVHDDAFPPVPKKSPERSTRLVVTMTASNALKPSFMKVRSPNAASFSVDSSVKSNTKATLASFSLMA